MNGAFSSRTEFIHMGNVFLDLAWENPTRKVGVVIEQGRFTFLIHSDLKDQLAAGIIAVAPDAEISL